jgi:hypothetical protein
MENGGHPTLVPTVNPATAFAVGPPVPDELLRSLLSARGPNGYGTLVLIQSASHPNKRARRL